MGQPHPFEEASFGVSCSPAATVYFLPMPKFSGRSDVLTVDKDPRPAWIDLGLQIP